MTAVLKHELKNYFRSMTAYVFGAGLLLAVGLGAILFNIEQAVSNFEYALSYFSVSLSEYVSTTAFGSVVALCVIILALGAVIQFLTKNENLAYGVGGTAEKEAAK